MIDLMVPPPRLERGTPRSTITFRPNDFNAALGDPARTSRRKGKWMTHTAYRSFELSDGKHCFAYGEARYVFTVTPGRSAATWANASGGFSPAERPFVHVTEIEVKEGRFGKWMPADGLLADYLGNVPDAWFLEQIAEDAE